MNTERPEVSSQGNEMDFSWELWQSYQDLSHHDLSAFILVEFEHLLGVVREADQSALLKQETVQRVYRLAYVLWQSQETICDLKVLLKEDGYDALLEWTLSSQGAEYDLIKLAIDRLLCSVCSIEPDSYFDRLLTRLGILSGNASCGRMYKFRHVVPGFEEIPDLDDLPDLEDEESSQLQHTTSIDLSSVNLSDNALKTLSTVSLSYMTANQLINSNFLSVLIDSVVDFLINDGSSASESHETGSSTTNPLPKLASSITNVEVVTRILDFFSQLCWQNICKIWFRSDRNTILWECLLRYLCSKVPKSRNLEECLLKSEPSEKSIRMLEESAINYFSKCCCGRFKSQDKFSQIFYNVLSSEMRVGSDKMGLSNFLRRILVEFVMLPQHVYISIETDLPEGMNKIVNHVDTSLVLPHPAFPTSEKRQLLYVPTDYTPIDILRKVKSVSEVAEEKSVSKEQPSTSQSNSPKANKVSASSSKKCLRSSSSKLFLEEPSIPQAKKIKVHNYMTRSNCVIEKQPAKEVESGDVEMNNSSSAAIPCIEQLYKLTFWNSNMYEYEEIDDRCSIAKILQTSVPPEDELGVTILKFFLSKADDHRDDEREENPTTYNSLSPHSAFKKFVALDGFTYIALHIEKQERLSSLQSMSVHTLLAFGLLIRLPEYRASIPKSVLQAIIGSSKEADFTLGDKRIFSKNFKSSHNPLMLLPFDLLQSAILKIYESNAPSIALNSRLTSAIDIALLYLAVCTHQPVGTYSCAIDENKVFMDAMRQSYISRVKTKKVKPEKTYWPSGTGYSTCLSSLDHVGLATAAAASSDKLGGSRQALEEEEIVTTILDIVGSYLNPLVNLRGLSSEEYATRICGVGFSRPLSSLLIRQIEVSCLLRVIADNLKNDSVFDIVRHIPLYKAIMSVLCAMVSNVQLRNLVLADRSGAENADDESPSIPFLMTNLRKRIQEYLRRVKIDDKHVRVQNFKDDSEFREQILLEDICNTADIIETIQSNLSTREPTNSVVSSVNDAESRSVSRNDYVELLQPLQFGEYDMMTEGDDGKIRWTVSYHYDKSAQKPMVTVPGRIKRLALEITSLASSLPLSRESAIFIRHDSSRIDVIKALISGPPGTPYMNGLFEFDIFCPSSFPNEPIKVNFETTGKSTIRFNPNLYETGNVCLSILNTWEGEKWNPQTSSILQVLVSIQGMILIPEPYFNEPGFERHRDSEKGRNSSKMYNDNLLPATVRHAMIEQILSPTECFKEVILTHFYLKKDEIKNQVTGWISECRGNCQLRLQTEATQLFELLNNIEPPTART